MKEYINVLKQIEEHGFEAYIVGGFVRDKILKKFSKDIDIITNATPLELKKIFKNIKKTYEEYGVIKIEINKELIDITTYRKELSYNDGKPIEIEYTNNLREDLERRDFTINTICMDSKENIIDLLNGLEDINNKVIKTVRNAIEEFEEDPTRIIRALRFMTELDFNLHEDIINYILKNKNAIKKVNIIRLKEELDKIFKTKNVSKFLKFIKKYNLEESLGIKSNNFKEVDSVVGVWSQLNISDKYIFNKKEQKQIKSIKELLKKKKIEKYDIYKNGLEISNIVAEILELDKKEINLIYTNLPIKDIIDIDIKSEEICEILNIKPGKRLGEIIHLIEYEIIESKLENKKVSIINRLNHLR